MCMPLWWRLDCSAVEIGFCLQTIHQCSSLNLRIRGKRLSHEFIGICMRCRRRYFLLMGGKCCQHYLFHCHDNKANEIALYKCIRYPTKHGANGVYETRQRHFSFSYRLVSLKIVPTRGIFIYIRFVQISFQFKFFMCQMHQIISL